MKLENFLRDRMRPNLRGMKYPVSYLDMGRDRDGTKPPWNGTSRPSPAASLPQNNGFANFWSKPLKKPAG